MNFLPDLVTNNSTGHLEHARFDGRLFDCQPSGYISAALSLSVLSFVTICFNSMVPSLLHRPSLCAYHDIMKTQLWVQILLLMESSWWMIYFLITDSWWTPWMVNDLRFETNYLLTYEEVAWILYSFVMFLFLTMLWMVITLVMHYPIVLSLEYFIGFLFPFYAKKSKIDMSLFYWINLFDTISHFMLIWANRSLEKYLCMIYWTSKLDLWL